MGYLRFNPADACELPRIERKELKPLDDAAISAFLQAVKGHRFEVLYTVTLFTGMREGEVLGLAWDCVDFDRGTITISKQLQKERGGTGTYHLVSPKNGKGRTITPASAVMDLLRQHRAAQIRQQFKAGPLLRDKMAVPRQLVRLGVLAVEESWPLPAPLSAPLYSSPHRAAHRALAAAKADSSAEEKTARRANHSCFASQLCSSTAAEPLQRSHGIVIRSQSAAPSGGVEPSRYARASWALWKFSGSSSRKTPLCRV